MTALPNAAADSHGCIILLISSSLNLAAGLYEHFQLHYEHSKFYCNESFHYI